MEYVNTLRNQKGKETNRKNGNNRHKKNLEHITLQKGKRNR